NLPAREGAVLTFGWVAIWAILARFHPQQQFWHDALAGTRLISCLPPVKAAAPKQP
ncbi:MAG: RDD family protein, partial [Polaromonas sp.]